MSSIGSNQSSKRCELVSIAECESSGLLVTFFMAWSPGRRFNAGDSRLITPETTPPSIPTNPATGPDQFRRHHYGCKCFNDGYCAARPRRLFTELYGPILHTGAL